MAMAKILLVEDYESIRNVYAFALAEDGFDVESAGSGAEALQKVAASVFDLICLDMVMLQYSGLEFLEAFHKQQPKSQTKVIVLSNIDSPKIVERAKALGVTKYLIKSHYTPKELSAEIRGLLNIDPTPDPK
jgi:CheY-like chemotaxis protein